MNVYGFNTSCQNLGLQSLSSLDVCTPQPPIKRALTAESQHIDQDKVSISPAGRRSLADAIGKALHSSEVATTAQNRLLQQKEKDESLPEIDKKIKAFREKLEELRQALTALQGEESQAAERQRKQLQDEIAAVNNQLMSLLAAKEKQAKA